jgi:hypothetical protein
MNNLVFWTLYIKQIKIWLEKMRDETSLCYTWSFLHVWGWSFGHSCRDWDEKISPYTIDLTVGFTKLGDNGMHGLMPYAVWLLWNWSASFGCSSCLCAVYIHILISWCDLSGLVMWSVVFISIILFTGF